MEGSIGKFLKDNYENDWLAAKLAFRSLLDYINTHELQEEAQQIDLGIRDTPEGVFRIDLTRSEFDAKEFEMLNLITTSSDKSWQANLVRDVNKLTRRDWEVFLEGFPDMTAAEMLEDKFFAPLLDENQGLIDNPNKFIADLLDKVAKLRSAQGEAQSSTAHRKGASLIRKQKIPIGSYKDARSIKGIGDGIATKVKEILHTATLEILNTKSAEDKALEVFQSIWGVGPATASVWLGEGYRTLADIRQAVDNEDIILTRAQALGLLHYDDLQMKMQRKDMELIFMKVKEGLDELGFDYRAEITGSYRRGGTESKDVDILVWPAEEEELKGISNAISEWLTGTYDVSVLSSGEQQLFAIVNFDGTARRLDLFFAKKSEYPAAMLAHSGPAVYNVATRQVAIDRGMLLNEKHLYDENGDVIPVMSEADIQKALGLPILAPKDRK